MVKMFSVVKGLSWAGSGMVMFAAIIWWNGGDVYFAAIGAMGYYAIRVVQYIAHEEMWNWISEMVERRNKNE